MEKKKQFRLNEVGILVLKVLFIIIFCFIVFKFIFGLQRMKGNNMIPAFTDGDLLLYYRIQNSFNVDDVIVIKNSQVLRIVATENQIVDIDKKGRLLVDGNPEYRLSYYQTLKADNSKIKFPYKVKKNSYFVLNDYRTNSNDSRNYGVVKKDKIKGKIIGKLQIRNL